MHFEDHNLALSVRHELTQLRARNATVREIDAIADNAALPPDWQPRSSRKAPDDARNNTWLALKELAQITANNESAVAIEGLATFRVQPC